MRVPDVSTTAADCAAAKYTITSNNNYQRVYNNEHYFSFQNPSSPTSEYNISSGEEFIRRALNSSFTEICNNYSNDDDTITRNSYAKTDWNLQQPQSLKQHHNQFSDTDNILTKRHKDISSTSFLTDKRQSLINNISNTPNTDDNHIEYTTTIKNQDTSLPISLLKNGTNRFKINYCNSEKRKYEASTIDQYSQPTSPVEYSSELYDNDWDDYFMDDLSSDAISFDNSDGKDDFFLTSSSSSCDTLQTIPHLHFPRGIINPNYPGFQHLAHTLSEHFRNSSSFDTYDSDMSDNENKFNISGSLDNLVESMSQTHLNIFNNNEIQYLTVNDNGSGIHDEKNINVCSWENGENTSEKYETLDNVYWPQLNEHSINLTRYHYHNVKELDAADVCPQTNNNILKNSTQPDILMKNIETELRSGTENRPDILNCVSPQLLRKFLSVDVCSNNEEVKAKESITNNKVQSLTNNKVQLNSDKKQTIFSKDCTSLSTTNSSKETDDIIAFSVISSPINIIGDFGLEVEQEFGLLVSGYKLLDEQKYDDKQKVIINECTTEKIVETRLAKTKNEGNSTKRSIHEEEKENKFSSIEKLHTNNNNSNNRDNNGTYISENISEIENTINIQNESSDAGQGQSSTIKYQKRSYDDRELPPVIIEYKTRCQRNERGRQKLVQSGKLTKCEKERTRSNNLNRTNPKVKYGNKISTTLNDNVVITCKSNKRDEELEYHQYQQLLRHKDEILSNSKYTKLSSWAQYLKDSIKERKDSTASTLELIDAYKVGPEMDMETLNQHIKMAKEIEKKRRNNREEIRRRLAMGSENEISQVNDNGVKSTSHPFIQNEIFSDADETNSSDSETCPKLSKFKLTNFKCNFLNDSNTGSEYNMQPYSDNYARNQNIMEKNNSTLNDKMATSQELLKYNVDDMECDFFTKQAKLQIETRMALSQAKEMAHRQMEINRQKHCMTPITAKIRNYLEQINVLISASTRRVSRQMLSELNIAQLQILVNNFQTYIKELNDTLVNYLMERDDLHLNQDAILADIEELTCYLGVTEPIAHQERLTQ